MLEQQQTPNPTDKTRNPENQDRPRLTVLLKVYYERPNKTPYEIEQGYTDLLSKSEQVYHREDLSAYITGWSELDYGWVKKPAYIIIENTDEKNTLLVGFRYNINCGNPSIYEVCEAMKILPGKFHPIDAIDHTRVMVRCKDDGSYNDTKDVSCRYTLHVIPG
jgi:hypothetical protein